MDRKIERKPALPVKWIILSLAGAVLLYLGVIAVFSAGSQTLNVERNRLVISEVILAPFQENITISGTIVPQRSIFMDAIEGGRVERIYVEAGSFVHQGDTLLVLSNNNLQLDMMNRESQILEQINTLRNTRLQLQQQRLSLRSDLLAHQTELSQRQRDYNRDSTLYVRDLVARHQFEESRNRYHEALSRTALFREQLALDSLSIENQFQHIDASIENMIRNLDMVSRMGESLVVTAPISGQLTSLDAEIGESKTQGQRIGQIDITDSYKIRAVVDEIYLARLETGQTAEFDFAGSTHSLTVTRIYPEVSDGRFQIDLDFAGNIPESVRRGQSVRVRLALSDFSEAVLVPRGGFFQSTGGQWLFVVNDQSTEAVRRPIRLGRQNSQFFVVEEGLEPGERVITSGYDTFGNANQIRIQ